MLSFLLVIGMLLGAADTAQTWHFVGQGYAEANPVWASLTPTQAAVGKTLVDTGLALGIHRLGTHRRKLAIMAAFTIVAVRFGVVAHNYHVTRGGI
jgi:hypothetical protein